MIRILILSQTSAAAPAPAPSLPVSIPFFAPSISLDTIFWLTVFLIFLITILSALVRRLSRDKALRLFHEYHVAFFSERRATLWGDCIVSSQGVELLFDQAFITRRQLLKSSALIYEEEYTPMICFTRSVHGLNARELGHRAAQIHRTFHPGVKRRMSRWSRNMLNTMRDAITKTMSLIIGRMSGTGLSGAITTQAGDIGNLTGTFVGLAANAYEPLLERYIGQPVVIEISLPPPPGAPPAPPGWVPDTAEFPGYLVDYTQRFIAVFNVEHTPVETFEVVLEPGKPPVPDRPELKITLGDQDMAIRCNGKDAYILRTLVSENVTTDLGIAMIPGTSVVLAAVTAPARLTVERTRQIDVIVPRTRGRVRFGAMPVRDASRRNWLGIAPVTESRDLLHALRERAQASLFNFKADDAPSEKPPDDNAP